MQHCVICLSLPLCHTTFRLLRNVFALSCARSHLLSKIWIHSVLNEYWNVQHSLLSLCLHIHVLSRKKRPYTYQLCWNYGKVLSGLPGRSFSLTIWWWWWCWCWCSWDAFESSLTVITNNMDNHPCFPGCLDSMLVYWIRVCLPL